MVIITLHRDKCIGCNYCTEFAPEFFRMSKADGKSVLLKAQEKRGFFTFKTPRDETIVELEQASQACPVKIIAVKLI